MNMMIDEYDDYDDDLTHGPTQPYIGDLAAADDDDEDSRMFPKNNVYFFVVGGRI